jgi:hypothetical protein
LSVTPGAGTIQRNLVVLREVRPMSEPMTYPAPVLPPPSPPKAKWQREYHAFLRLLPELLQTHRGRYVAIHDEQVVDSGEDELALASRVWAKYGYVPIHVELVTDRPQAPSRAMARTAGPTWFCRGS